MAYPYAIPARAQTHCSMCGRHGDCELAVVDVIVKPAMKVVPSDATAFFRICAGCETLLASTGTLALNKAHRARWTTVYGKRFTLKKYAPKVAESRNDCALGHEPPAGAERISLWNGSSLCIICCGCVGKIHAARVVTDSNTAAVVPL